MRSNAEWLTDSGTSTCVSLKSPLPINTLSWLVLERGRTVLIRSPFLFQVLFTPFLPGLVAGIVSQWSDGPTKRLEVDGVPSTADGFRAAICSLRSPGGKEGVIFHTFTLP